MSLYYISILYLNKILFQNEQGTPILRDENEVYNDMFKNHALKDALLPGNSAKAIQDWWDLESNIEDDKDSMKTK